MRYVSEGAAAECSLELNASRQQSVALMMAAEYHRRAAEACEEREELFTPLLPNSSGPVVRPQVPAEPWYFDAPRSQRPRLRLEHTY
jgi:hypothetical protein